MGSIAPQSPEWADFYGKLYSRRVDLVGDYAGSEPFLVDGDSLLLHCFSDDKLDFQDGFQMLHAVWLVECFLHGLHRRNCNFHLVFFDDHAHLCVPSHAGPDRRAKYLLARAVILRHLKVNVNLSQASTPINILVFPSLSSPEFNSRLVAEGYMFVMMNDGAADPCTCETHARDKAQLRSAICHLITHGYNVALINGLEWRDTKVITAIIEGTSKRTADQPAAAITLPTGDVQDGQQDDVFTQEKYEALSKFHESAEKKLSERLYLVSTVAAVLHSEDVVPSKHIAAFIAHAALQGQVRLGGRSYLKSQDTEAPQPLLHHFASVSRSVLQSPNWQKFVDEAQVSSDIADLVDGRLFSAVLGSQQSDLKLTPEFQSDLQAMISLVASITGTDAVQEADPLPLEIDQTNAGASHSHPKLLPFSDSVFDEHLAPVKLEVDSTQHTTEKSLNTFRELTHWRNSKRPLNRKAAQVSKEKQAFYARRRDQRFMAEMMAYAASLTNAVGKALEPETIILQEASAPAPASKTGKENQKPNKQAEKPNKQAEKPKQAGKSGGGKNKGPSKKQAIKEGIAAERDKKDALNATKTINSWAVVYKEDINRVVDPAVRYVKVLQYLNSLPNAKRDVLGAEVELCALGCLIKLWEASVKANPKTPDYGLAARIWDTVARLKNMDGVTKTMASKLQLTADSLGLPFSIKDAPAADRKLAFEFPNVTSGLKIPLSSKEFQLLHCGPYFDRTMDSAPDDRVPFRPDGWQRKVLDVIDAEQSLFVVAPTSAGKTFISFYAMKKVLEASNEDVLVYVAPTKALVNQIAAEIQARFSKSYKHAGKSVWGIHTRDYRVNSATGCQVLVTVPDVLQIMLLSPANADSWSSRIKRIIFDEVHCIGQADDGIVWEQLLLLAPCPIIALSATVGNPQEFHSWLAQAQKSIGTELVMVHHPYRYSDLRKFVYVPPKEFDFTGLPSSPALARVGLDGGEGFEFVHPVASLFNRARGIPEDFALEGRDCYTLWQSMKAHETETHKIDEALSPTKALPAVITQTDIIKWGNALKKLLVEWMADPTSPFDIVVKELSRDLQTHQVDERSDDLVKTVLPLLCQLHEQASLPAILFNYDRGQCEDICRIVMDELKSSEEKWKESSPKWEKKMAAWEVWKKNRKNTAKKAAPKKAALADGMGKADLEREAASSDADPWENFDPNAAQDGFHFMDRSKLLPSELNEYARQLTWRGVPEWLIEALYRGIAVHHAGMNRKYRHVVELLFRKGYLRVVIATGTLALGINMPCKTVVFCGDSVFLTALNYRQAAGRAGRRGFDVLGNVVFHGISSSKVCRLLSSRLPDLTGHFPITTTLVLRLCSLLTESKHSAFSVRSVGALLSQHRLYLGGDESRKTVLHHLRFSLEYLRRQFLLDQSGAPLNFAGLVSHLYYTESSNFAFHALLKEGYFHQLCAGIRQKPETTERIIRTLMLVLSHIFARQYCRQVDREFIEEVVKNSPSGVFLPPMPEEASTILREHNRQTLDIFSNYVQTFVEQHVTEEDNSLPLSGIKFGGSNEVAEDAAPTVRSHFVALSGHGDSFQSISELCNTVRSGVFLEEAVVPHVPLETDVPLNAYLFDFFKHGDVTALADANRIRKGEVWFVLNDFSMILATIITSLTNFISQGVEGDLDILDAVGGGDAHAEQQEERFSSGEPGGQVEQPPKTALPVQVKRVAKKKVADSWEGEMDEAEANGEFDADEEEELKAPAWEDEGNGNLLDVLEGFKRLSDEFNEKFKAMWA